MNIRKGRPLRILRALSETGAGLSTPELVKYLGEVVDQSMLTSDGPPGAHA